jgi:hypothetical protein
LRKGQRNVLSDNAGTVLATEKSSGRVVDATIPAEPSGVKQDTLTGFPKNKTILLSEPFSNHWKISNQARSTPQQQLGVTMAFELDSTAGATKIRISYFYLLLWLGYALSCGAMLLCFALVLYDRYSSRRERNPAAR